MGHRAYYPAYEFWIDDLENDFQLFINPLVDNLSRKIRLVDLLTFVQENLELPLTNLFVDGVTITGTGTEDDPFVANVGTPYTDEQAQDTIGSILTDTDTINFTYNDGTPSIIADIKYQMSITSDTNGLKFVNDVLNPAASISSAAKQYVYGTDSTGAKGWQQAFIVFDGGTAWSPFLSSYIESQLNHGSSGGAILLGAAALGNNTGANSKVFANSTLVGNGSNLFYATNVTYTQVYGYGNCINSGNNPLWRNTIIGTANSNHSGNHQYNTIVGDENMLGTVGTSSNSVAVGYSNLDNITGNSNVSIGGGGIQGGIGGSSSTGLIGIGYGNGGKLAGADNIIVLGTSSLNEVTTGGNTIALGNNSGDALTIANNCILIGHSINGTATDDNQLIIGATGYIGGGQGTWLDPAYQTELGLSYNLSYDNATGQVSHYPNGGLYSPTIGGDGTNSLINAFYIRSGNTIQATVHFSANLSAFTGGNANVKIDLPVNPTLANPEDVIGICKMEKTNESTFVGNIEVSFDSGTETCNVRFGGVTASWTTGEHITVTFMYEIS